MVKYLMVASAAIYSLLMVFGDESRRPEVTRHAVDDTIGLTLAAFALPEQDVTVAALDGDISDSDAIAIALEAGKHHHTNRPTKALRGTATLKQPSTPVAPQEVAASITPDLWYVTGSKVNLRAGPGTGNAVVGQLVLGDAAEVLSDAEGWYQIRSVDGSLSGWIYGKFLADTQPG